jgi:hypothetical protein
LGAILSHYWKGITQRPNCSAEFGGPRDAVDGGDLDPAVSEVLHDHVARKHNSDLIIRGQRLVRQRGIASAAKSAAKNKM